MIITASNVRLTDMIGNFANGLRFTLSFEGGKANDPVDPGGRTNKGITQRTYATWLAHHGQPSKDVFNISDAEVSAIYKTMFWDAINADALPSGVDVAAFDLAVNSGPGKFTAWWKTISQLKGAEAQINAICNQRLTFMHRLGKLWERFGKGWTRRVNACKVMALALTNEDTGS